MTNATRTLSHDDRREARRMLNELLRILHATGRYNITLWPHQMAAHGWPVSRRNIYRWIAGTSAPTVETVERLAIAAGVDLAYLYGDRPVPYTLTDAGRVVAEAVGA